METFVSKLDLLFFYYLSDSKSDVVGVLKVNAYVPEDATYMNFSLRLVTESEHDTMAEFGLPKFVHDAKSFPFFEDIYGHTIDIRA
jgi:hypothetical protein